MKLVAKIFHHKINLRPLYLLLLIPLVFSCTGKSAAPIPGLNRISKLVLIVPSDTSSLTIAEKNDLKSLKNVLLVVGIHPVEVMSKNIRTTKLSDYQSILLPFASTREMKGADMDTLAKAVQSGTNILLDGASKLTEHFGIKMERENINVNIIGDTHFSHDTLYWTTESSVLPIDNGSRRDSVLAFDITTRKTLAIGGNYGKGKFIYLSPLFDPNTDKGYSRFPFLIEWLQRNLDLKLLVERQAVEMYFDPGMRCMDPIPMETLAKMWRHRKIKRVYAAGWYYDGAYNYEPLFKACHDNGIQVYCWLETPEVTDKMWKEYPEWREKTATGRDAHIDWRYLMNVYDKNCRAQVFKEVGEFLNKYDWDGVNFAEMYFEPHPEGFEAPKDFTPMNTTVREEFKKKSGFDPIQLFDEKSSHYWKTNKPDWRLFADYRKELSFHIKGYFLDFLTSIQKRKNNFDVMFTGIDVSLKPTESDNIAEDTQHTLELYKKYNITLQIEDPSNCWGSGPERYDELGKLYRKTVKDKDRLVFDCNVVGSHEHGFGGFPSEKPSGEELRQIAYNMSLNSIRPAFYSEDAVNDNDSRNISTVMAREAVVTELPPNKWLVNTPYTITVKTGKSGIGTTLDGEPWFTGEYNQVIVPQGKHTLAFDTLPNPANTITLLHITGELKWARFSKNELSFGYSEAVTASYVIIDRKPSSVYIDNVKTEYQFSDGKEYSIKLPKGEHQVKINSL
jgi:hypothetical protein